MPHTDERKLILQELFEKYMQGEEKVVNKEDLPQLVAEYEQVSGQSVENAIETIAQTCNKTGLTAHRSGFRSLFF